ncbi:RluA family pseudouridine synthase [Clostridium felsineum]|uniref:RluA family pseudouridine synthase n=1 Tax=Clostridium felsineum TaxID=36839 RepID=UPI00098C2EC0|nr:RluA family pseudouridine synthase [Clostridium felsineum]URZ15593.1 Ribosomal large subunit pseudouridine synthase C [Clostridium felsineum DSM 794]
MKIVIGPNEAGQRADKFIRKWLKDVPLSAIYKAFRKGDVIINEKKCKKENYSLVEGDTLEIKYIKSDAKKKKFIRIENNFKVTYEDDNILLVEKWPGVLVHSDKEKTSPTLTDYVLSYLYDKGDYAPEKEVTFTPSPCNRLDRNTSGIVIYGKNFEALKCLNEMVRERKVKKYYYALVKGRIKDGIYEAYIKKDITSNKSEILDKSTEGAKKISMEVKCVETCGTFSFVEIELLTGRSHQLRAHLSHLGNPILGDPKYGIKDINSYFDNKFGLNYQFLYAYKLIFKDCPEKLSYMENKTIAQSLPPIFKKVKRDVFKF